jgi:DNA-binding transcriptional ArsR family regulator
METKLLLSGDPKQYKAKDIMIFDDPERLKSALNSLSWRILQLLSQREMYPMEMAKTLEIHEQKIYYHIRKLQKAGVVKVVREEEKKGAVAKYYKASFPALGVELPFGYRTIEIAPIPEMGGRMGEFLSPFLRKEGSFDGKIVVGSPDPHGPFKARARDGHYASYLTFYLGRFADLPEDFAIKLDVDVKVEKEESNNLILVGGPGTNLITQEINEFLPMRFNMMPSKHGFLLGGLISEETGNVYTGDTVGLVAKIVNPADEEKRIIVLAGNKAVGTKACVLALTRFWKETLKNFTNQQRFATVIQGFDLDGDGKVDSIEVLE